MNYNKQKRIVGNFFYWICKNDIREYVFHAFGDEETKTIFHNINKS